MCASRRGFCNSQAKEAFWPPTWGTMRILGSTGDSCMAWPSAALVTRMRPASYRALSPSFSSSRWGPARARRGRTTRQLAPCWQVLKHQRISVQLHGSSLDHHKSAPHTQALHPPQPSPTWCEPGQGWGWRCVGHVPKPPAHGSQGGAKVGCCEEHSTLGGLGQPGMPLRGWQVLVAWMALGLLQVVLVKGAAWGLQCMRRRVRSARGWLGPSFSWRCCCCH